MVGTTGQGWGSQMTGFHNNSYGWLWRFDHSTLAVGSVPIARIPDIGSASVNYASSAGSLSANPANCSAGQFAAGISATGAAEGCADTLQNDLVWFGNEGIWLKDLAQTSVASCDYMTGSTCYPSAHGQVKKQNGKIYTRAWTSGCSPHCDGRDSGWVEGYSASVTYNYGSVQCKSSATAVKTGVIGTGLDNQCSYSAQGWQTAKLYVNGNVGIGTTAPGAKLDVAGAIRPQANATSVGEERNQEATVRIYNDPKTCNSANEGAIRYKNNRNTGELCFCCRGTGNRFRWFCLSISGYYWF